MCLAVPGQVLETQGNMATVDVSGVKRRVSIDLVDNVNPGDYVLVHVGFALQKIDEQEALETIETLRACFNEEMWQDT